MYVFCSTWNHKGAINFTVINNVDVSSVVSNHDRPATLWYV